MHYLKTLKTQEFRTKDFFMRSTHSIEHQKCKYCVGLQGVRSLFGMYHTTKLLHIALEGFAVSCTTLYR